MPDAANLAATLYELKSHRETVYRRIVTTIRQVAPFFEDFDLETTNSKDIILNWRHRKSDLVFGPHQLSDGTLRAICLISLLLQPKDNLPYLIVVDEPELGLHPYAAQRDCLAVSRSECPCTDTYQHAVRHVSRRV